MKRFGPAIGFGLIAVACFALAFSHLGLQFGQFVFPSPLWDEREQTLERLLIVAGVFVSVVALLVWRFPLFTMVGELWNDWRDLFAVDFINPTRSWWANENWPNVGRFALILLTAIGLRVALLDRPMQYDESYTFLEYVDRSAPYVFFYTDPNNHVGHTILVKLSSVLFGTAPPFLRLPAMIAGIGSIVAAFAVARRVFNSETHQSSMALMSAFPFLVLFDTMARGYSMVVLFSLLGVYVAYPLVTRVDTSRSLLLAVILSLGLFVVPTFLMPATGIVIWVVLTRAIHRRPFNESLRWFLIPVCVGTSIMACLLYTPVVLISNGVAPIVANKFVLPLDFSQFVTQLPGHMGDVLKDCLVDVPIPILVLIGTGMAIGIYFWWKGGRWDAMLLFPCLVIGSLLVLTAKRSIPFSRTWIFLIPFVLLSAGAGIDRLIRHMCRARHESLVTTVICVLVLGLSSWSVVRNRDNSLLLETTGNFPTAEAVAGYLKSYQQSDDIYQFTEPLMSIPVNYYLTQFGGRKIDLNQTAGRRKIVIDAHPDHQSVDSSNVVFRSGDTVVIVVPAEADENSVVP